MKKLTTILVLVCFIAATLPINLLAATSCGVDLNHDGFVDTQNEIVTCTNYPVHNRPEAGDLCPFQTINCKLDPPIQPIKECLDPDYSYVTTTDRCEKEPVCPAETNWDAVAKGCINDSTGTSSPPDCGSGQFDSATGVCTTPYTFSQKCAVGTYNPTTGMCESIYSCPLGNGTCFDTGGAVPQCSPHHCVDMQDAQNEVILPPPDDSYLRDDGEVDEYGTCLGELYIFTGKSAGCRPPGYQVGLLNDCCDSDATITDSKTGNKYSTYVSAAKTVYQLSKVAYYSYQIGTGAMTASASATGVVTVASSTGATVTTFAAGSEMAEGVMAAGYAQGGEAAVSAGLQGYTSVLINPTTIAVAVAVAVAIRVLYGNGCKKKEIEAAIFSESGYCHYLGKRCAKKIKWIGCVQKQKRFCCFNSKMARIVAEQGRPQLKAFGPSGGWGSPKHPHCRGFTAEEFQQLDFAKIDLTEYFGDIMDGMNQNIEDVEQRIQHGIQNHYEQTRP